MMHSDFRSESFSLGENASGASVPWEVLKTTLKEGLSSGVELIEIRNGVFGFSVIPTRGLGIWEANYKEHRIGWDSPVRLPVHPAFVNLKSRNGLGWLDGFNELLCRCGLSFNGPPGLDEAVGSPIESDLTLHGKIANLPAHSVQLVENEHEVGIRGIVDEATLFGPQLRLESTLTTPLGSTEIHVHDVITNLGSSPTELQLLYHTNIGSPLLGEGAKFACAAELILPRDSRAAEGIDSYETYLAPTSGYAEQVYFFETLTNEAGESLAMVHNQNRSLGFCVRFNKQQLPCFSQWKCTQDTRDGYVTGLEPGINFPNFKSFERRHGRVVQIGPGESYSVNLTLSVLVNQAQVDSALKEISSIQGAQSCKVCVSPELPYSDSSN